LEGLSFNDRNELTSLILCQLYFSIDR
jgi:hypothetical protein